MKKVLMRFSDNILSRSQMKAVKGGSDYGSCCVTCESGTKYCVGDENDYCGACSVDTTAGTAKCTDPNDSVSCYV